VATSTFPRLAAAYDGGDLDRYRRTLAASTRAVILLSAAAAAALVATAQPAGGLIAAFAGKGGDGQELGWAIAAFAPGLLGYGLLALLTRGLYAAGVARATAVVTTLGWVVVIVADIALAVLVPIEHRVAALAAGHTVGMTVLGAGLLALTVRRCGAGALAGVVRASLVGVVAAAVAGAAGFGVTVLIGGSGVAALLGQGILGGAVVLVVFVAVAAAGDPGDVRPLLRRVGARAVRTSGSRKNGERT
jgi:putative peptidoglycan lipid II flippase